MFENLLLKVGCGSRASFAEGQSKGLFNAQAAIEWIIVLLISFIQVAQAAGSCHVNIVMRIRMEATCAIERDRHSEVINPSEGNGFPVARVEHGSADRNVDVYDHPGHGVDRDNQQERE